MVVVAVTMVVKVVVAVVPVVAVAAATVTYILGTSAKLVVPHSYQS